MQIELWFEPGNEATVRNDILEHCLVVNQNNYIYGHSKRLLVIDAKYTCKRRHYRACGHKTLLKVNTVADVSGFWMHIL